MKNNRLLYLWCVLTVGVVLISLLPGSIWIYHFLAAYDSNRWGHFLAYASVATIPVAAWKRRTSILIVSRTGHNQYRSRIVAGAHSGAHGPRLECPRGPVWIRCRHPTWYEHSRDAQFGEDYR